MTIEDSDADLQHGVDESYTIDITQSSQAVNITAKTIWGTLHAFTTFQQLVIADGKGTFMIEQLVSITYFPNYPHRGSLIDSGRNFISVPKMYEQIDGMALSKMNVFHWHIVDTQSWPLQMQVYPQMTQDAYSPQMIYSQEDIRGVIAYARARGVRMAAHL